MGAREHYFISVNLSTAGNLKETLQANTGDERFRSFPRQRMLNYVPWPVIPFLSFSIFFLSNFLHLSYGTIFSSSYVQTCVFLHSFLRNSLYVVIFKVGSSVCFASHTRFQCVSKVSCLYRKVPFAELRMLGHSVCLFLCHSCSSTAMRLTDSGPAVQSTIFCLNVMPTLNFVKIGHPHKSFNNFGNVGVKIFHVISVQNIRKTIFFSKYNVTQTYFMFINLATTNLCLQ